MGKIVTAIVSVIGALWLLFAGVGLNYWWDHRPAGQPAWAHINLLWWHWSPPDSLAARLEALEAGEAQAAARAVALDHQNASLAFAAGKAEGQAQGRIQYVTRTLIKEIPSHVTPQDDLAYPLSVGLVRLHDAAARGVNVSTVPGPSGQPDSARSVVPPSDLAVAFVNNYAACRADAEQLDALNGLLRKLRVGRRLAAPSR